MVNTDSAASHPITFDSLPAILIGGPPNAGKSSLTYNLTRELRRYDIPHYVFRANPDIEGDWYLQGDLETVGQIQLRVRDYRHWTNIFRDLLCRDLTHHYLPLIVDLGGLPQDADNCIFQACTHSILLLKRENEEATRTWHRYITNHKLDPIAELYSQLKGTSNFTIKDKIITGTITGLKGKERIDNPVFDALFNRVRKLFSLINRDELEKFHLSQAPQDVLLVHLPQRLEELAPDSEVWTADLLQPLLAELPVQTAMAVYGRAPNWLYGALALHAGIQPFYQFDARLGWVTPPALKTGESDELSRSLLYINEDNSSDAYVILIHPVHNYLDYRETGLLVFPEPPYERGIVVSGKLPLWLFTALARFYAQRDVSWIALNDARENRPVIIYSKVTSHPIGTILPKLE